MVSFGTFLYPTLLALQFGMQPFAMKQFMKAGDATSFVLVGEILKIFIAIGCLALSESGKNELKKWSFKRSFSSALPAALFTVQNICLQISYSRLTPTVHQLMNQTKILWAAFFVFILLGERQTRTQVSALFGLMFAAIFISFPNQQKNSQNEIVANSFADTLINLIPAFTAAVLSGFNAGLTQLMLQGKKNTPIESNESPSIIKKYCPFLNIEAFQNGFSSFLNKIQNFGSSDNSILSDEKEGKNSFIYSMELGFYSIICLIPMIIYKNSDHLNDFVPSESTSSMFLIVFWFCGNFVQYFFRGWTVLTFIPVLMTSVGGLIVGQVVKYCGSVIKGYALVFGILITTSIDVIAYHAPLTFWFVFAVVLAVTSMFTHITQSAKPKKILKE